MRKLKLLPVFMLLLISCSTTKPLYTLTGVIGDYSYLIEKGFFVSKYHENLNFEYIEIGEVIIECRSGYQNAKAVVETRENSSNTYVKTVYVDYKTAELEDGFKKLYEIAQEKGANGIIDLTVTPLDAQHDVKSNKSYGSGYYISGQLIRK